MVGLPQALDKASQSINTKTIKIEHFLVVRVEFRGGDSDEGRDVEVFNFSFLFFPL
jgi:hypothetical protein